ncbi:CbtA family protein, partial [Ameyamaea chiangmaiensis]
PPEPALFSRATQAGLGLLTAALAYGAAFGGLFSIVFALCYGRVNRMPPRLLALVLALAGFVAVVLVPDLKYPPNPPAVGNAATIGLRTATYAEMIVFSLCAMVLGTLAGRHLVTRLGVWNATLGGVAIYAVLAVAFQTSLPDISEVPANFPALTLWRFREAAIGMQLVLWSGLGLIFGAMAERVTGVASARA